MMLVAESTNTYVKTIKRVAAPAYEVDPLFDSRWTTLVESNPRSSVFHSPTWLRVLRNIYGYEPVVITTSPPGAPLNNGIVFCRIRSWLTGSRFVSLPFSDHCEPLVDNSEEYNDLLIHMRGYVDSGKWKYAEIRPLSFEPGLDTKFGQHLTYCFHRLNLTSSSEKLFRSFHKDCVQRKIRRAERERLRYELGNSDLLLHDFYQLFVAMRRRKGLPPQPLTWFQTLAAEFGNDMTIRIVYRDKSPIACILTLTHKKSITYKYGCSDTKFNNLGGMALLLWNTIKEAKHLGYEELEFGRSDSDNLGLIAFKDHWGAISNSLTYWKYPNAPRTSLWMHNSTLRRATSSAPTLALKTLGRLLYRHIG